MKILPYAQGSEEWLKARSGIPTASEFDQLVTPEFKVRTGAMWDSYLAKKVAERWLEGPLPSFNSFATDQGKILEDEAMPFLEFTYPQWGEIRRVGLIINEDWNAGCSPDGLLIERGEINDKSIGLEIKCPEAQTHVKYLIAGELPKEYVAQVHGSMLVTGLSAWKFVSYRRNFPPFVLNVERDETKIKVLKTALAQFNCELQTAMDKLKKLD